MIIHCEPSQRCKTCPCPRELLYDPPNLPARRGRDVQKAVMTHECCFQEYSAWVSCTTFPSFQEGNWSPLWKGEMVSHGRLHKSQVWRSAEGFGRHPHGGEWSLGHSAAEFRHYDFLVQAMKDSMHGKEHGTCDKMLRAQWLCSLNCSALWT